MSSFTIPRNPRNSLRTCDSLVPRNSLPPLGSPEGPLAPQGLWGVRPCKGSPPAHLFLRFWLARLGWLGCWLGFWLVLGWRWPGLGLGLAWLESGLGLAWGLA